MLSLRVEGIPGLQQELKGKVNPNKIDRQLKLGVTLMTAETKKRCPIDSKKLHDSITYHKKGDLTYEIMATAEYADYVEYGTFKMYAGTPQDPYIYTSTVGKYPSYRPFLRSAVYDKFNTVVRMIEQSLEKNE